MTLFDDLPSCPSRDDSPPWERDDELQREHDWFTAGLEGSLSDGLVASSTPTADGKASEQDTGAPETRGLLATRSYKPVAERTDSPARPSA